MILIGNVTPEAHEYMDKLIEQAEWYTCQMAVVDYLGFKYQHENGRTYTVTEKTPLRHRYGVRSMAHVQAYKFPTLYLNKRAKEAQNG